MKLDQILESDYDGLEDDDHFAAHICLSCGDQLDGINLLECAGGCGQELESEVCPSCATVQGSQLYCNDCWMTKGGGRHWQLSESDDYAGLEDADSFGEPSLGPCFACGRDIPEEYSGAWVCSRCDTVAHFSCAMPAQEDIVKYDQQREGITSTGWHYRPEQGQYFRQNHNVLQGQRVLAASRAYDVYTCPECTQTGNLTEGSDYEGLEDADEFEQDAEIEWRSVYQFTIDGVRDQVTLLIDVNNPQRWDVMFGENVIDDFELSFIQDLATWLGVQWHHQTSYEKLTEMIKDKVYLKAYKDNRWHWPPQWGRLWEPPQGFPPPEPPNWYY